MRTNWKARASVLHRSAGDDRGVERKTLALAFQFVRIHKEGIGANDLKAIVSELPDFRLAVGAKLGDLSIFPAHDFCQELVRPPRLDEQPAVTTRVIHCIDWLKHCL